MMNWLTISNIFLVKKKTEETLLMAGFAFNIFIYISTELWLEKQSPHLCCAMNHNCQNLFSQTHSLIKPSKKKRKKKAS